jgi:hypothetical protein
MPRPLLVLACAAACLAAAAPAYASGPAGLLTQPAGAAGCITQDGTSNAVAGLCADGRGLTGAEAVAVSPDGRFVYSSSVDTGAIAILSRDPASGVLSQADAPSACVGPTDLGGDCTDGPFPGSGADSSHAIAISPDGAFLFAAGHGVGAFRRDVATGALTAIGCVSADGKDADGASTCTAFPGLGDPLALAVSPDGRFVYAGGLGPRGLAILSVSGTGALGTLPAPDGCFTNVADVECTTARYADQVFDITLSPDGHSLYAVNIDVPAGAVVGFERDAATGKLTQIAGTGGCVDRTGTGPQPCTPGHGMVEASTVTVSPDGTLLTIGTQPLPDGGVTVLHRDPATGALSQSAGAAGCVNSDGSDGCGTSRTTDDVYETTFTADGRTLFAAGYGRGVLNKSGIAVFDVGADGVLTQRAGAAGCHSDSGVDSTGTAGGCTAARGILGPVGLTLSPHGDFLYASSNDDGGVATFRVELAPACSSASAGTAFATPVAIPVTCTDANGDTVTLAGVDGPAHGTVAFSGLTATYTPAAGFSGDDSFRVKGNDGANDSAPATVTVRVGAAAAPPAGKKTPLKLSLGAKPKRDKTLPYKFRFSGRLTPAGGATCSGKVVLTVKHGRKRVARKSARLSLSCKWKAVVKFNNRKKLGRKRAGTLTAKARFGGNAALTAKSSKTVKVRYG